jgi:hypothetical protein
MAGFPPTVTQEELQEIPSFSRRFSLSAGDSVFQQEIQSFSRRFSLSAGVSVFQQVSQ